MLKGEAASLTQDQQQARKDAVLVMKGMGLSNQTIATKMDVSRGRITNISGELRRNKNGLKDRQARLMKKHQPRAAEVASRIIQALERCADAYLALPDPLSQPNALRDLSIAFDKIGTLAYGHGAGGRPSNPTKAGVGINAKDPAQLAQVFSLMRGETPNEVDISPSKAKDED